MFKPVLFWAVPCALLMAACGTPATADTEENASNTETAPDADHDGISDAEEASFVWKAERFADTKIIRYQVPGFYNLSPKQRTLVYYLNQAGLSGRDMMYDQNFKHNLEIRKALETVYTAYQGDKANANFVEFELYLKRVWFANGIHHHYANTKFNPGFDRAWFEGQLEDAGVSLSAEAMEAMFDPTLYAKKVEKDATKGLVEGSAVNFYDTDMTTEQAEAFYATLKERQSEFPLEHSLNSRLMLDENGEVYEDVYKVGGLYGPALEQVVYWLNKAEAVAENDKQAAAIRNLVKYYETGDLAAWVSYNINWVNDTEGDIDYINGFVEVYNDPLGYTGSYETIVEIKDFEASERMSTLMNSAQWFEDNSPFMNEHKKDSVVGITYNVVNVAGEAGDASPSTPIGVNLPNANWIRVKHGSKSVSLGNIVAAYDEAGSSGMLEEFAHDREEIERTKAHSTLAGKLHTAMHEVIGHASGQIEAGVGETKETLKNYSSTIEEGRADLVALYYMLDPKMVELGLMETLDVGKAEYDSYIRNGMLAQLRRLELGADIEEAHMRNRAWVSGWVLEKGAADNVIARVERDGKVYYDIQDYEALRVLFGELLKEVQRIKSQGDFEAAMALVEGYGVKVDQAVHQQVLDRCEALNIAPYGGFVNPIMEPVMDADGNVIDVKVTYPNNFAEQMLYYSETFGFLSK